MILQRLPLLLSCALLLAGPWAAAQGQTAPRSYGVLSELARELSVIHFQQGTGSNLDQNIRQRLPIPDGMIDRAALALAKAQVVAREPGARVHTFVPLDSDVFDPRQSFAEGSAAGLPADLAAALRQQGSSHLLLLTRHQADTAIQVPNAKIGSGRMEGLGFYIDNMTVLARSAGGAGSRGFLAPFVYMRATLIDVASGQVVRSRTHTHSMAAPASPGAEGAHPWDALDDTGKVRMLTEMLDQALSSLIPQTLARP